MLCSVQFKFFFSIFDVQNILILCGKCNTYYDILCEKWGPVKTFRDLEKVGHFFIKLKLKVAKVKIVVMSQGASQNI